MAASCVGANRRRREDGGGLRLLGDRAGCIKWPGHPAAACGGGYNWSVIVLILGQCRRQRIASSFWHHSDSSLPAWVDVTCARKQDALRGVAGGDLRPPGTSVFDGSRHQQVQVPCPIPNRSFPRNDEDSSKPDMLINRLSSGAARTDLPARRSVSSRHSGGDSAVGCSRGPGQMPSGRVPKRVYFWDANYADAMTPSVRQWGGAGSPSSPGQCPFEFRLRKRNRFRNQSLFPQNVNSLYSPSLLSSSPFRAG